VAIRGAQAALSLRDDLVRERVSTVNQGFKK